MIPTPTYLHIEGGGRYFELRLRHYLPPAAECYLLVYVESWSTFSTPKMPLTKMGITWPTQGQLRHGTLCYVAKSNREIGFSQFLFSFSPWKLLPPRKLCASKSFEGGALFSDALAQGLFLAPQRSMGEELHIDRTAKWWRTRMISEIFCFFLYCRQKLHRNPFVGIDFVLMNMTMHRTSSG